MAPVLRLWVVGRRYNAPDKLKPEGDNVAPHKEMHDDPARKEQAVLGIQELGEARQDDIVLREEEARRAEGEQRHADEDADIVWVLMQGDAAPEAETHGDRADDENGHISFPLGARA